MSQKSWIFVDVLQALGCNTGLHAMSSRPNASGQFGRGATDIPRVRRVYRLRAGRRHPPLVMGGESRHRALAGAPAQRRLPAQG